MSGFLLVDKACDLFEKASGCRLHRNPASGKCKVLALGRWQQNLQQEDIPLPYLKLTDNLDYLGCKLFASYSKTRKENGSDLKKKVSDQIKNWKSGKFMPFTSRPWSLNVYCLSKIWYKTACLDLLLGDSTAMTSCLKGWLYQDMILKPQEMMLYRQTDAGGLGLINIRIRALAMLIHTFLTLAVNPNFQTNHYLQALFKWHVEEDREISNPGRPPYFSNNFFELIREVHTGSTLNVKSMSLKQWYKLLLEKGVTHNTEDMQSPPVIIASKLESNNPSTDFSTPYFLTRLFGLSPEQKAFLFKWLNQLLPTRERLHRLGKVANPHCLFCPNQIDDLKHLLQCSKYAVILQPVLRCVEDTIGYVTASKLVLFDLELEDSLALPIMWLLSKTLMIAWESRVKNKALSWPHVKAEIRASASILHETRWNLHTLHNGAVILDEILQRLN